MIQYIVCGNSVSSELQLKTFHEGLNFKAYEFFGCHCLADNRFVFRVWAPHAAAVSVVIDYRGGDERIIPMALMSDGESWQAEAYASLGDKYVYRVSTVDGRILYKADPYAYSFDLPNSFSSIVAKAPKSVELNTDAIGYDEPVNIYEVNLLSWKRHKDKSYYTYSDLERELVPYVRDMGYTHVEFMPINEFPYDGSWGYQVTGYFAVTSRLGSADDFGSLVAAFHSNGIKVIVDWVPAHFPKDDWGLYEFDGAPLYECPLWDRMEHSGWGTRKFDYGRGEVDSFLISSAIFLFDKFAVDGLRVDAVASMLYLDYDKEFGQWTPNIYGDNRNLEAIELIKKLNSAVKARFPASLMIAEESTSYDGVTRPISEGGLGFDYKWNMGWMNDTLFYCRQDPYFRNHHHGKITFSLMYAFSEKYILPLSHDEVVYVKGSIVNKMYGEYDDKFAGERALLGYMYAHPGKKLNFMGYEFAQFSEWDYNSCIDFFLKKYEKHRKISVFVKHLNLLYRSCKPLYEIENGWDGFKWHVVDDRASNLIAFSRYAKDGSSITAIINFSGVDIYGYPIEMEDGKYRVILNTDSAKFGGTGRFRKRIFKTKKQTSQSNGSYLFADVPRLTCMYIKKEK